MATFHFYVSDLSNELEELIQSNDYKASNYKDQQKQQRNLKKNNLFRIYEWKDYAKFNTSEFLKKNQVEIPDRWINAEELNKFNLLVSKVARENNCKLRVRMLGLDTQNDIWKTHKGRLHSPKYFFRVNRTLLSRDNYEKQQKNS